MQEESNQSDTPNLVDHLEWMKKPGMEYLAAFILLFLSIPGMVLALVINYAMPEEYKERSRSALNNVLGIGFYSLSFFFLILLGTKFLYVPLLSSYLSLPTGFLFSSAIPALVTLVMWALPFVCLINMFRVKKGNLPFQLPLFGIDTFLVSLTQSIMHKLLN